MVHISAQEDQKAAADLYYKALKTDWVVLKLNCLADSCHRQSWKLQWVPKFKGCCFDALSSETVYQFLWLL